MSSSEYSQPSQPQVEQTHSPKSVPAIETVYTTVESQTDRTDWLTVVSNLRQINRQLVEQIARLEQTLASVKQESHRYREENQCHEITILQQQDELSIAHDRVGALFQQLENSHQIGQRQQTLIESLSQQLDISQAIVPQLEAETEHLSQQYQQQTQKLIKTERVAVELHRRLKIATGTVGTVTNSTDATSTQCSTMTDPIASGSVVDPPVTSTAGVDDEQISEHLKLEADIDVAERISPRSKVSAQSSRVRALSDMEISAWTPSAPRSPKSILPPPQTDWHEAITSNNDERLSEPQSSDPIQNHEEPTTSANWPSPTLDRTRPPAKKLAIDLPKFPKKSAD